MTIPWLEHERLNAETGRLIREPFLRIPTERILALLAIAEAAQARWLSYTLDDDLVGLAAAVEKAEGVP